MIPGQLNKIVEIQKPTAGSVDDYGGPTATWSTHAKVWGRVSPLRGRELINASALKAEGTVLFITRYVAGVTAAMRILFDGLYYDIAAPPVDVDMRHKELQILTKVGMHNVS